MIPVFVFVFGLIVGSFLNALIYRLWDGSSVMHGRSFCPSCKHQLVAQDLVPVFSFILLRAKCRYCHTPISWQYPLVELAAAFSFVMIYFRLAPAYAVNASLHLHLVIWAVYTSFLIIIFVYDLLHYLILDSVIIPAVVVAFVGNLILGVSWSSMLLAALGTAGFFALQFVLSRGKWIGGGDIRLGFLMGIMLGWPTVLVALFISYVVGAVFGIGLIVTGKKSFGSKIPFGTFLTIGSFVALLYGSSILTWYVNSLSV